VVSGVSWFVMTRSKAGGKPAPEWRSKGIKRKGGYLSWFVRTRTMAGGANSGQPYSRTLRIAGGSYSH
jgi:hypothetical protein